MIIQYHRFNTWANQKLNTPLLALSDAQFDQEVVSSFPSMRKTLLHIWDANKVWLVRLNGESLSAFPSKDPAISGLPKKAIIEGLQASCDALLAYAEAHANDLSTPHTYKDMAGNEYTSTREEILHHVVNHATFHRGQVVTLLRQLGVESGIPATDFIRWAREVR